MKSPVKSVSYEPLFDMEITKQGFTIHRSDGATAFELEEFANRKVLSKKTGVSLPPYQLVDFSCQSGPPESYGLYVLLLDKKSQRILSNRLRLPQNGRKMTMECMNVSIQHQKVMAYALL